MDQTIDGLMEQNVQTLRRYTRMIEDIKEKGGLFFNGCRDRAYKLRSDLEQLGNDVSMVFIISPSGTLTYESGALWRYHYCVMVEPDKLVFDPAYTKAEPVPIEVYPSLYLEDDLVLWKLRKNGAPELIELSQI